MALLILSPGMFAAFADSMAARRRGLPPGSPPPIRAAIVISLMILVKILPRLASRAPLTCLILLHLEWPDIPFLPEGFQGSMIAQGRQKKGPHDDHAGRRKLPGNGLLFHTVTSAVPSALEGLTTVFGMGTGVA